MFSKVPALNNLPDRNIPLVVSMILLILLVLLSAVFGITSCSAPSVVKDEDLVAKRIVLVADTHYGNTEGDGYKDDVQATWNWIKSYDPDYIFLVGDVTEDSDPGSWDEYQADVADMVSSTSVTDVFSILGGNHDGFTDGESRASIGGGKNYGTNGLTQMRGLDKSPLYTFEIGNNAFIFINHIVLRKSDTQEMNGCCHTGAILPQVYLEWTEKKLSWYRMHGYNTFIVTHIPPSNTTVFTSHGIVAQLDSEAWLTSSAKLREIIEANGLDALVSGHVHNDPDDIYKSDDSCSGTVAFGRDLPNLFQDVPDTTFINVGCVCYEHGLYKLSEYPSYGSYPSIMILTLAQGSAAARLEAANVHSGSRAGISYNNEPETASSLQIPLSHDVSLNGATNIPSNQSYAWLPYKLWDESTADLVWICDTKGFVYRETSNWIQYAWRWCPNVSVVPADVKLNYTEASGTLSTACYYSDDGSDFIPYELNTRPVTWFMVNTVPIISASPLYLHDISPRFRLIFDRCDAVYSDADDSYIFTSVGRDAQTTIRLNSKVQANSSIEYIIYPNVTATIGDITVCPESDKVQLLVNTPSSTEVCNFSVDTTNENDVTFGVCSLAAGMPYLVRKADTIFCEIRASDTGCIVFENREWPVCTFTIEALPLK